LIGIKARARRSRYHPPMLSERRTQQLRISFWDRNDGLIGSSEDQCVNGDADRLSINVLSNENPHFHAVELRRESRRIARVTR
jgi:hypothetical protein